MLTQRLTVWSCVLALGVAAAFGPARADSVGTPAAAVSLAAASPPVVLSPAARKTYGEIFALQEGGHWRQADRLIKSLGDRLLMGHVLFQRYMHPTKYRSSYQELAGWLKAYADHPGAWRVYRLANKRRPANYKAPRGPVAASFRFPSPGAEAAPYVSALKRTRSQNRAVRRAGRQIRRHVARGFPTGALKVLMAGNVRRLMDDMEFDRSLARIAGAYFLAGKITLALEHATAAGDRSAVPSADWIAGLAAWRLGRIADSAGYFERLALSPSAPSWTIAGGAYWAARANLVARRPERVNRFLDIAGEYPLTFYGQIARRQLGLAAAFDWSAPPLTADHISGLSEIAAVRRALALTEIDRFHDAEQVLRLVLGRTNEPDIDQALLALASRLNLPATLLRLADLTKRADGSPYHSARYPVPSWKPTGGFTVDRALIYAFVRQESRFNARAKSRAGARGLMQFMPRTAAFLTRDRTLRWGNADKLFKPEFNIALGQKYIAHLINFDRLPDDLFTLAAAYNGGPGNLMKWRGKIDHQNDPLLFIETLPYKETRNFVKQVMTNFWIYRSRLGQETPSLDAVAAGEWPHYTALETAPIEVAAGAPRDAM